ncbi:sensor histidine kinase [Allonocardiopsis opalescens]|uniref:histidine kinase n=1 Tax=Allonocardiopsis opalescens TaxID=1144618 RepID=A0A2T0QAK4_9ACTN|nr:histidine kinase [Allonocardiopsis opalescens]PRY00946.1 histidine kinase [Allonocardiopsis opalescens]
MRILRSAAAPLLGADTYRRWVYLVLGGVLFTPFLVATLVLLSLLLGWGASMERFGAGPQWYVGTAAAAVLGAGTVWIPGVRAQQAQLSRALLGGPLAALPAARPAGPRIRAACWLALHFAVGFAVCITTMVGLTQSAMLALAPFLADEPALMFLRELSPTGGWTWLGPPAGAVVLLALVYLIALIGAGAARLAPRFLGPTAADRLAAAQARADNLTERNRLAAELHDSIGHVLSVVALQAGAAARVIDRDPAFARGALETIAEQARTATAELDHMLGLLREERAAAAPQRTLADLPRLVAAARTAGADLRLRQTGTLDALPEVLSRELYRICQEGVTNALRHGGENVPVTVDLRVEEERVRLVMTNPADPARPGRSTRPGGGRGLRGMRERVELLGGELTAGAVDGVWRLAAAIPWKERT